MTAEERAEYEKLADELDFKGNISAWKDETLKRKVDEALEQPSDEPVIAPIENNKANIAFEDKTFINDSHHPLAIGMQTIIHGKEFSLMPQEKTDKNIKTLRRLYEFGWVKEA